jgi:hypothetical protein
MTLIEPCCSLTEAPDPRIGEDFHRSRVQSVDLLLVKTLVRVDYNAVSELIVHILLLGCAVGVVLLLMLQRQSPKILTLPSPRGSGFSAPLS